MSKKHFLNKHTIYQILKPSQLNKGSVIYGFFPRLVRHVDTNSWVGKSLQRSKNKDKKMIFRKVEVFVTLQIKTNTNCQENQKQKLLLYL